MDKASHRACCGVGSTWQLVLKIIAAQSEQTAVIVTEAGGYRDDLVEPYVAPDATTPLRPEDVWAPQVHSLALAAVGLAREQALYVALDANQLSPGREALTSLLLSIDGCGVMGSSSNDDPETILSKHVDQWDTWVREGRLGQALKGVDALPVALDRYKPFIRIQLIHRAGHLQHALGAIRDEILSGRVLDAYSRVKLARIAVDAYASDLATQILHPAIDELDNSEELESALATSCLHDLHWLPARVFPVHWVPPGHRLQSRGEEARSRASPHKWPDHRQDGYRRCVR